jgi:hypothetical protein
MYLQISDTYPDGLTDRAASQWFVLVVLGFVPCFTATTMWIAEQKVLNRETADNTYPVWLFYVAKVFSIVPFELFFGELFTKQFLIYQFHIIKAETLQCALQLLKPHNMPICCSSVHSCVRVKCLFDDYVLHNHDTHTHTHTHPHTHTRARTLTHAYFCKET